MVNPMMARVTDPITLGPVTLPNRVFVAPHTTNFGEPGVNLITSRHLDYHRERARGGAGLIITEGIRVHPTSLRRLGLHAYDDSALPGLTALSETVHAEGGMLFAQLLHTGRHSGDDHAGSWGASEAPWTAGGTVPHVMNRFDLDEVVSSFAAAAHRVIDAGFDGLEVHLGHGHLLQQFLSPVTNHRTDEYGGDASGRLRLAAEVLAAVHTAVAGRVAFGVRISADEFLPGGLGPDEVVDIVRSLTALTPFDFVHVSHSAYIGEPSLSTQMADMSYGRTPFRHLPARFKQEFPELAVLAICRIDTIATGQQMLDADEADLVGYARAHIAEPALLNLTVVKRTVAGTRAPRSCIACNQGCNANLEAVTPITCTVNPAVGREREWNAAWNTPAAPRRVLVIGAGPAGLEAATTASRRGHLVELWERGDELGGQLLDVVRMDGRDGFATLLHELQTDLAASTATAHLGTEATATAVLEFEPDAVVLATGSRPAASSLVGGSVPVLESVELLRDSTLAGPHTVIVDETGTWEAYGLALHLAERGVRVEIISSTASYAARVTVYSRLALAERLSRAGVAVHPATRWNETAGRTVLVSALAGTSAPREGVSSLVHVRPRSAVDSLSHDLLETGWSGTVHLVGDAFAPRTAQEAVAEGRGVALTLGVGDSGISRGIRMRPPYVYPRKVTAP